MLLVGAIIGISGGVAANLFNAEGVLEIDAFIMSEPVRASIVRLTLHVGWRWLQQPF